MNLNKQICHMNRGDKKSQHVDHSQFIYVIWIPISCKNQHAKWWYPSSHPLYSTSITIFGINGVLFLNQQRFRIL